MIDDLFLENEVITAAAYASLAGKNPAGEYQKVIVPAGVLRLYFGIMDVFEWNNNSGSLTGAILIEK